jgi:putative ATP-dependent endonuclease of OLD family
VRNLGSIRATTVTSIPEGFDNLRLIYLPAHRNPLDELARREAQILVELLRAQQQLEKGHRNLVDIRNLAAALLDQLTRAGLIESVERRIRTHLSALSVGVSTQYSFVGGQRVDDAYLARVLELLLGAADSRALAQRLELSGLGYVNLLHIAITLAAIPDTSGSGGRSGAGTAADAIDAAISTPAAGASDDDDAEIPASEAAADSGDPDPAHQKMDDDQTLNQAEAEADAEQDAFFPDQFHVIVMIEEPEAHLHPQLQHGLIRYLRRMTHVRPELQLIVTTHASDIVAACDPEELVIMRRSSGAGNRRSILVKGIPFANREHTLRMAKLHLDATRSGSLFAERVALVEGVTDAVILRQLGASWAANNTEREGFVDALAITVIGAKVGPWCVDLLATPGHEIVDRVAILRDSDTRNGPPPVLPVWITDRDPTVKAFVSHPTLEPSLVAGNEEAVSAALVTMGIELAAVDKDSVDETFSNGPNNRRKGEFALELALVLATRRAGGEAVHVPNHIRELFEFLWAASSGDTAIVPDHRPRSEGEDGAGAH